MCNTWFKCNKLGSLCLALKDRELECPGDSDLPDFCQRRSRVCLALSIWVLVLEERGVGESSGGKWINQLPESQERDRIINPSVTFTSLSCHWRTHSLSRIVAPPPPHQRGVGGTVTHARKPVSPMKRMVCPPHDTTVTVKTPLKSSSIQTLSL